MPAVRYDLHGITLLCESPDLEITRHWEQSFSSLRPSTLSADIAFRLHRVHNLPVAPAAEPLFMQGDLLAVARISPASVAIHFPRFGQLRVDLAAATVTGELLDAALETYGVLEDVVAMGLTALLRRRGMFLIHAFAAAYDGRAVLLVGDIGSGKTTSGISLLRAGWRLISNDSPLLARVNPVEALAYPGLLSAYPDTLRRFPELAPMADNAPPQNRGNGRRKMTFAAESIYPNPWIATAPVGAIVFPHVAHRPTHEVQRLGEAEALRRLLPNAIDRWDTEYIPQHLQLLRALAASAPAYQLALGEDTDRLPTLLASLVPVP